MSLETTALALTEPAMFLTRWLKSESRTRTHRGANNQPRFRPTVEGLEAREVPAAAFFLANDGTHGMELWKTDGTTAGTTMVKDINQGANDSGIRSMITYRSTADSTDMVYFVATDGTHGQELWKSDGTEAGTVMVKDINPGSGIGLDYYFHDKDASLVKYNGAIYFRANDGTNGAELWKSDGTAAGTTMVKDIYGGKESGGAFEITLMNGRLYFEAKTNKTGYELYATDGTAAGTVMVKDVIKGSAAGHAHGLIAVGNTLYFTAYESSKGGMELWKSDGTAAGTVLVKNIAPTGGSIFDPYAHVAVGTALYFQADDGVHGRELWKTDGTAAGTVLVADLISGSASSYPVAMTAFNGKVYFVANDQSNARNVWVSDGTAAGTGVLLDSASGPFNDTSFQVYEGRLYISDLYSGVWSSDGTATGTVKQPDQITPLATVNGQVLYSRYDSDHGNELWVGEGTTEGTSLLADIWPGTSSSYLQGFIVVG